MISKREIITLVLVVIFGLIGAWLYSTGREWLANLCVIPPAVYYLAGQVSFRPIHLNKKTVFTVSSKDGPVSGPTE